MAKLVLTFSCPDSSGIVASITRTLADMNCNIISSDQFADTASGRFFMRVAFTHAADQSTMADIQKSIANIAPQFAMDWSLHDTGIRKPTLIMVSKFDHCLMDLLYRNTRGALDLDIRAVVSNHRDAYKLAASYDIPFFHLPVTPESKQTQEEKLIDIIEAEKVELVILARYMQIFSDKLCARMDGQVINIHHSFLPSFKGAKPYHQAHQKGVKLIGATAHYVTPDLDEGPIIEQNVARVNHAMTPEDLVMAGRDVERMTLAEAVKLHSEHRVLRNGDKTVVFKR